MAIDSQTLQAQLQDINQRQLQMEAQLATYQNEFNEGNGTNTTEYYILGSELRKLKDQKPTLLKEALNQGVDLRPYYGETYADAVKFKQDLGQYAGKDESMIIPANPVGYGGKFKFDPNFGSAFYRDLATQSGKALGLSDEDILNLGTSYFKDKFASGSKTAGVIGFTDFGKGLIDRLARVGIGRQLAANGQLFIDDGDNGGAFVTPDYLRGYENQLASDGNVFSKAVDEKIKELNIGDRLKPLYDANQQVFSGLNNAARIESQSSGFFKQIGADIAKLGPIGTIALTAALGPAAGALAGSLGGGAALATGLAAGGASALPGLLQGDISGAIKSGLTGGALAGIGAGALKGVGSSVSDALGGGSVGNIAGGAAQGAIRGGVGSLLTGGDLGQGILLGGLQGGVTSGVNEAIRPPEQLGTGITPGAGGQTGITPPANFDIAPGVGANLPSTTGYVNSVPGIGGLLDNVQFPTTGITPPGSPTLDLGSGLGQGLQVPASPTVPGQLGQGLTVQVPGGTLGQGGVTPTGQITIGDPSSLINQPAPTVEQAPTPTPTPGVDSRRLTNSLIKALLATGAGAAVARGIGGLSNSPNSAPGPTQPGPSDLALDPTTLNRNLGFQFQAPQYTAGLGGMASQMPQYDVINPQAPQAPGYLRGFAGGGVVRGRNTNAGIGALLAMLASLQRARGSAGVQAGNPRITSPGMMVNPPAKPVMPAVPSEQRVYAGGSPNFNESTGRFMAPPVGGIPKSMAPALMQVANPRFTSPGMMVDPTQAGMMFRRFAEGGEVEALNAGIGSIPMAGRFLQGPGDGMSDDIPANIDGEEEVRLAEGEYIIPAQAVSALGNGSSKAGAKVLDAMVKRVYKEQTGKSKQMKPMTNKVLPA